MWEVACVVVQWCPSMRPDVPKSTLEARDRDVDDIAPWRGAEHARRTFLSRNVSPVASRLPNGGASNDRRDAVRA